MREEREKVLNESMNKKKKNIYYLNKIVCMIDTSIGGEVSMFDPTREHDVSFFGLGLELNGFRS